MDVEWIWKLVLHDIIINSRSITSYKSNLIENNGYVMSLSASSFCTGFSLLSYMYR